MERPDATSVAVACGDRTLAGGLFADDRTRGTACTRVVVAHRLRSIAELGMEEEEKDKEAAKDRPKESKPRAKPAPKAAKE